MFKKKFYLSVLILTLGLTMLFAGPSAAMKFRGTAMVGQHYNGNQMLNEYFLMIKKQDVQSKIKDVRLKKLSVDDDPLADDTFHFDDVAENHRTFDKDKADDFYFFSIDDFSASKYQKKRDKLIAKVEKKLLRQKAREEGLKFREIKKNRAYDMADWEVWASDLGQKFFNKKKFFKVKLFDDNGKKYKAKVSMAFFMNSAPVSIDKPHASVPEPATMLLLGVGLLGLAGMRRRFKK